MKKLNQIFEDIENNKSSNFYFYTLIFIFLSAAFFLALNFSPYPEYDELAYIDHVKKISQSDRYWYLGDRNRMPIFNYILFISYSPNFTEVIQYRVFQLTNIIFVTFFSIFYLSYLKNRFVSNVIFLQFSSFSLFLPIICYIHDVVVEPIFYVIFAVFFVFTLDFLKVFNLLNSVKFGFLAAFLYLIKATGLSIFVISIFFIIIKKILEKEKIINIFKNIVLSIVSFLIICSPYMYENYQKFDKNFFYNVNTTFYIWYDSWEEVETGTKAYGDRIGYPAMPEEDIPSLKKYLSTHSNQQIYERFRNGLNSILNYYFSVQEFTGSLSLSLILVIFSRKYFQEKLFVNNNYLKNIKSYLILLSVFVLFSSAFYQVIAPIPRFTIYLFLPAYLYYFLQQDKLVKSMTSNKKFQLFYFNNIVLLSSLMLSLYSQV